MVYNICFGWVIIEFNCAQIHIIFGQLNLSCRLCTQFPRCFLILSQYLLLTKKLQTSKKIKNQLVVNIKIGWGFRKRLENYVHNRQLKFSWPIILVIKCFYTRRIVTKNIHKFSLKHMKNCCQKKFKMHPYLTTTGIITVPSLKSIGQI